MTDDNEQTAIEFLLFFDETDEEREARGRGRSASAPPPPPRPSPPQPAAAARVGLLARILRSLRRLLGAASGRVRRSATLRDFP